MLRREDADTDAFIQFGELSYYTAYAHAINLTKVQLEAWEGGWRARIKGKRKGRPVIAFLTSPSYTSLIILIGSLSDKDDMDWWYDKYP